MTQNVKLAKAIILAYMKDIFSNRDFDALSAIADIDSNNIPKLKEHFTFCRDVFDAALKEIEDEKQR